MQIQSLGLINIVMMWHVTRSGDAAHRLLNRISKYHLLPLSLPSQTNPVSGLGV